MIKKFVFLSILNIPLLYLPSCLYNRMYSISKEQHFFGKTGPDLD